MNTKYSIDDRVVSSCGVSEGVVIAITEQESGYIMYKVKWGGFFGHTAWEYECLISKIITK